MLNEFLKNFPSEKYTNLYLQLKNKLNHKNRSWLPSTKKSFL